MREFPNIILRTLLVSLITVFALEAALQLAYIHLPHGLIERMPQYRERAGHRLTTEHGAREYPAGQRVDFEVTADHGDLYQLTCLSPAEAQPLEAYRVSYTRDGHGFRNDEPWPEDVDLVVIGDSFTAAELIAEPYWQGISNSILVLGLPGTGTLEQQRLFKAFALPRQPAAVVLAFFAGNDLKDTQFYADMLHEGVTLYDLSHQNKNPLDYSVLFRLLQFLRDAVIPAEETSCHYPQMAQTDPPTPVAFYQEFLPLLAMDKASLLESEMFQLTRASISDMANVLRSNDAELVLMYIPQKAELYWNYLDDTSKQEIIEAESQDRRLTSLEKIDMNLSAQREAMRDLADEIDVRFLDLTPPLEEAIRAGQPPYFFADTHWNQAGHNIARKALLDFLNQSNLEE